MAQVVEQFRGKFAGEEFHVASQKNPCLILDIIFRIICVIVPVEEGLALLFQIAEERFLHLVEYIESHEGVVADPFGQSRLAGEQLPHDPAIERALIGQSVRSELGVQPFVERQHDIPQLEEFGTYLRVFFQGEVAEEITQYLLVLLVKPAAGVKFLYLLDIAEKPRHIGHILVHIVKVGEQPFSPPIEEVKRFLAMGELHIMPVKTADRLYRIDHTER